MMVLQMKKDTKAIKTWVKVQLSSIVVNKSKCQQIKTSSSEYLITIGELNFVFATDASPAIWVKKSGSACLVCLIPVHLGMSS